MYKGILIEEQVRFISVFIGVKPTLASHYGGAAKACVTWAEGHIGHSSLYP